MVILGHYFQYQRLLPMLTLFAITCLIFQTTIAIYLLHTSLLVDDFEKNLQKLMIILLIHLCIKYFLLAIMHDSTIYANLATGFSLLYGAFLYIITRTFIGKPLRRRAKRVHLSAFFFFSVVFIILIVASTLKLVPAAFISDYSEFYHWLVIASLLIYPLVIRKTLGRCREDVGMNGKKLTLIHHIAFILFAAISLNILFTLLPYLKITYFNDHDWKSLPYACFCFIPILILRYKLQKASIASSQIISPQPAREILNSPPVLAILNSPQPPEEIWNNLNTTTDSNRTTDPKTAETDKRYQKSGLNDRQLDTYETMLVEFIEHSKIYLDPELSLEELALRVKIPKHHLTQLLNDRFKNNFYAFINEYRIAEAIRILESSSEGLSILSLSYDCGFNSKSSFNNYFKKITGHTPSAYRKLMSLSA